jgi:biotin carboxyl carrier protein
MNRVLKIAGKDYECDVTGNGGDLRVAIGSSRFSVRVSARGDGFELSVDGARVGLPLGRKDAVTASGGTPVTVQLDGRDVTIECVRPAGDVTVRPAAQDGAEPGVIAAMMPGTIVKVMKSRGDRTQKGEVLLVLEAMKMENEVRSPLDGTVAEVLVAPGKAVQKGEVLMRIKGDPA